MQLFKTYFKIIKKNRFPLMIYSAIFMILIVFMFSNNKKTEEKKFVETKVNAAVFNYDKDSVLNKDLIQYLEKYVSIKKIKDTKEAKSDALFFRDVSYIITIPEGFTDSFLKGEEKPLIKQAVPDSIETFSVDNAIDNYLNTGALYVKYLPGISEGQLIEYVNRALENTTAVSLDINKKKAENSTEKYNRIFFNYLSFVLTACLIIGISTVMLSFYRVDIRRKHSASPMTERNINFQMVLANLTFAAVFDIIFILIGYKMNPNSTINTNTILFWVNTFALTLSTLSVSYLIGISVKSMKTVNAISTSVPLGVAFLCGVFVPQDLLGSSVLKMASLTPVYWYVKANNVIEKLKTFDWKNVSEVFGYMAIEIGFAAAILTIALVVNKKKKQQAF